MFKKVLLSLILVSLVFSLWVRFPPPCLQNKFPPLVETVRLQLDNDIHNDIGMPLFWVRFFHNKPVYFSLEIFRRLLSLGDINFLISSFSCILK